MAVAPSPERRGQGAKDTGERRRYAELAERVEDAENRLSLLDGENGLLHRMGLMDTKVSTILEMTSLYLPNINQRATKATSFWTVVAALTAIIVPITVVIIAGYFTLKSQIPHVPSPSPTLTTP